LTSGLKAIGSGLSVVLAFLLLRESNGKSDELVEPGERLR
jgi:hypothetical protein